MTSQDSLSFSQQQSGAVLLICLVLLVVISFVAVRGASNGNLQVAMARAEQFDMYTYSAARSELNGQFFETMQDQQFLVQVLNRAVDDPLIIADDALVLGDSIYDLEVNFRYMGDNATMPVGFSLNSYTPKHFVISASAKVSATGTQSSQTLGATYAAPK